ncbi:MAG: hypothetical protein QGG64_08845, partial [Candidatus Latescibacteria bacterium]|nr:hypothetical protein [Candidatus Latescibacterota bacterium]
MQKIHSWLRALPPPMLWTGILTTVALVHISYITNGYTWLDHGDLELGRAILPLSRLFDAFLTPFGQTGFYRPLITIVHSLDAALYNNWAPGYHLTNVLLHLFATGAFALFLNQFLTLNLTERLIGTLTAGIHPLSWLPAGAISYRPELLATLFVFLTIYFHAKTRTSNQKRNIILTALCAGLGFLSKESTLVWIPGLILIWELCTPQKRYGQTIFIWELLILIIYAGLRGFAVPDLWHASATTLPISQALGTRLTSIGILLWNLILPVLPALSDATPIHTITDFSAWITGILCLAMGITVLSLGTKSPWTRVLLFVAVAIAPALNLLPLPRFQSPHYGYLASFGCGMTA